MNTFIRSTLYHLVLPALIAGPFVACDAEVTNPDPITLKDLKVAKGLQVLDSGNGKVKLYWSGNNNETDFSGYNVFGAKWDTIQSELSNASLSEGKTLALLDAEGEPSSEAKALLAAMSYNGTDLESAGEPIPATEGEDPDFAYYPIYSGDKDSAIFPTCMPAVTSTALTAETEVECSTKTDKTARGTFNGVATFEQAGLKVGTKYCFIVLATLDSGSKVSNVSSELACITPRYEIKVVLSGLESGSSLHRLVDFEAVRTACGTSTETCKLDLADMTTQSGYCDEDTEASLCIETIEGNIGFTGGKNTGIYHAGERENGFVDPSLNQAPVFSISAKSILNSPGYSQAGHTEKININDMYVIADPVEGDSTQYYYHWMYITNTDATTGELSFTLRLSKNSNQR